MGTVISPGGPQLASLVGRLEADMASRRLRAGDPYLTSSQASDLLGVSRASAYRALRQLAERRILIARDRSGMYVSEEGARAVSMVHPISEESVRDLSHIYVLQPSDRPSNGVRFDQLMVGLRSEIQGATISFMQLPLGREMEFLQSMLQSDSLRAEGAAFIPISVPESALEAFAGKQTWPVAVLGSVSGRFGEIASVDADQATGGDLLADYLVERGHQRILAIMSDVWRQGDHTFFDAMQERLAKALLPANALSVRSFNFNRDEIRRGVLEVMGQSGAPTAIVCRYPELVPIAEEAVQQLEKDKKRKIEIVFDSSSRGRGDSLNYAHTEPSYSFTEYGQALAKMLKSNDVNQGLGNRHITLPVELIPPQTAV